MAKFKLPKQTSIATVSSSLIKLLRLYGTEYVRSKGDKSKVEPTSYSQEDVAKALSMTKAAYSKIENGDVIVNIFHLSQICYVFDISLTELMSYVDFRTQQLKKEGIDVVGKKLTLRLDHIRWKEKVDEKAQANFNKAIRELKKSKTYDLHSEEEFEELKQDCRKRALSELEKRYDLGEALSMQDFGMV